MSDQKLYHLCRQYGSRALLWRRKFIGLLPEVNRREIAARAQGKSWLEAKGFGSIFEFAARLAGVSEEQVRRALNLEQRFSDKPELHNALIEGKISINKLIHIAPITTTENAQYFVEQAQLLSTRALQTLARDEKLLCLSVDVNINPQQNILHASSGAAADGRASGADTQQLLLSSGQPNTATPLTTTIEVKVATANRLNLLQSKGFDLDHLINEMLDQRERQLAEEKTQIAEEIERKTASVVSKQLAALSVNGLQSSRNSVMRGEPVESTQLVNQSQTVALKQAHSRYIPVRVRRVLQQEHGTKCSIPHCHRHATTIHHTRRFALSPGHNPNYLAPLCREHHQIAHSIDQHFQEARGAASTSPASPPFPHDKFD
jgi:hypothetical protein